MSREVLHPELARAELDELPPIIRSREYHAARRLTDSDSVPPLLRAQHEHRLPDWLRQRCAWVAWSFRVPDGRRPHYVGTELVPPARVAQAHYTRGARRGALRDGQRVALGPPKYGYEPAGGDTDCANLGTFDEAIDTCRRWRHDGIGLVLGLPGQSCDLAAVVVGGAFATPDFSPTAEVVELFAGTYAERAIALSTALALVKRPADWISEGRCDDGSPMRALSFAVLMHCRHAVPITLDVLDAVAGPEPDITEPNEVLRDTYTRRILPLVVSRNRWRK